ncbi:MAG: ATP-binding cassette domain-containing protein [Clostridia bacterium]|nr:ATP-binding cassette domain-containing protein [Clostridia bacterium]
MSLIVNDFVKTFGRVTAVDHLSFRMDEPGVFGLIGTNGAGKTTTIRMMLGLIDADQGEATWNGKKISRESLRFGYMPEERGIYMKTKVREQLEYFGMLRGMTKADARISATRLMKRLGVEQYENMTADKLSKGNQQKVQLIAAIINDPELVVLDEPFSGLDPVNTDVLRSVIKEMVKEGKYVILSSHQMSVVEEYAENLVLLHKGRAVLDGSLREIKSGYGHTRLLISSEKDVKTYANKAGLVLLNERADEMEYKITGDSMARAFLKSLTDDGIFPVKYEIREPSLHEIFVEKAGEE